MLHVPSLDDPNPSSNPSPRTTTTPTVTLASPDTMFSTMHHPVYRDEGLGFSSLNPPLFTASSPYRPTVSSPLSSSPVRASTPPPQPTLSSSSPLSPCHPNNSNNNNSSSSNFAWSRDVQSSPLPASPSKPVSKFASRGPPRPNPLTVQKREAAQESRRKLFLKNVRQRAEDKRWERRGGEQEVSPAPYHQSSHPSFDRFVNPIHPHHCPTHRET